MKYLRSFLLITITSFQKGSGEPVVVHHLSCLNCFQFSNFKNDSSKRLDFKLRPLIAKIDSWDGPLHSYSTLLHYKIVETYRHILVFGWINIFKWPWEHLNDDIYIVSIKLSAQSLNSSCLHATENNVSCFREINDYNLRLVSMTIAQSSYLAMEVVNFFW